MVKVTEIKDLSEELKKKCTQLFTLVEIFPDYETEEEEIEAQNSILENYARYCLEHPS